MKILRNLSFGLLGLLVCVLMAATCVEKAWGTPLVVRHVYGSPWFVACWALMAVAGIGYLWRRRVQKRRATFLFHLSLVLILLGALVTHVWGLQGRVHLRQGEVVEAFATSEGRTAAFPFPPLAGGVQGGVLCGHIGAERLREPLHAGRRR